MNTLKQMIAFICLLFILYLTLFKPWAGVGAALMVIFHETIKDFDCIK